MTIPVKANDAKQSVLRMIYVFAYFTGIIRLFYFINRKRQIILTYHNVIGDNIYNDRLLHLGVSCSESSFTSQLNVILSRFKVTSDLGVPGSCIITFDDGYKNNIELAAGILNDKGVTGVFFVPACYFENSRLLWIDKLLIWISYVPAGTYSIFGEIFTIKDPDSRKILWSYIYETILKDYSVVQSIMDCFDAIFLFAEIKKMINPEMYRMRFEGMAAEDIDSLKRFGHKIGCHSYKHDILSLLNDEQIERDYSKCATYSEYYNTKYYSYPFGGEREITKKVKETCKRYGYSAAFVNYANDSEDVYSIGRISLDNISDIIHIEARLSGFESFLKKRVED